MGRTDVALLLVAVLSLGLGSTPFTSPLQADGPDTPQPPGPLSAWTHSPPSVDGVLDGYEWSPATSVNFTITYLTGEPPKNGTLFVMNDATNLYLGVKIMDSHLASGDVLDFHFDNDNDGIREDGDDVLGFDANFFDPNLLTRGFYDSFWRTDYGLHGHNLDYADGGSSDGVAAGAGDGYYNSFEFLHPLQSGDETHDFSLGPEDSVGVLVGYDDDGQIGWHWPSNLSSEYLDFAKEAVISIAEAPPPPEFSGSALLSANTVAVGSPISFQVEFDPFSFIQRVCFAFAFDESNLLDPGESLTIYSDEFLPYGTSGGFGFINLGNYSQRNPTSCLVREAHPFVDALLDGTLNGTVVMEEGSVTIRTLNIIVSGYPTYFAVLVSPESVDLARGASWKTEVDVLFFDGFNEAVTLGLEGFPSWATAHFSPEAGSANFTSTLTITASPDAPKTPSSQIVNITGVSATGTRRFDTLLVRVANEPPVANFTFYPTNPRAGQLVRFNGSSSFDPDGSIVSWSWTFGSFSCYPPCPVLGESVKHIYQHTGNYTVGLTVEDNQGAKNTKTEVIRVLPALDHDVTLDSIDAFPSAVSQGQRVNFLLIARNIGAQLEESVTIAVYYGSNVAATTAIVLINSNDPFAGYVFVSWDTSDVSPGTYTVSASVLLETDQDQSNNFLAGGQVTVLPRPDFGISIDQPSLTLQPGAIGSATITLTSLNGFYGTVSVEATVAGLTVFVDPLQVILSENGEATATLSISAASSTGPGTYSITVSGSSGDLSHTILVSLTIESPAAPPSSTSGSQRVFGLDPQAFYIVIGGVASVVALSFMVIVAFRRKESESSV